jgi:hypothetical protein
MVFRRERASEQKRFCSLRRCGPHSFDLRMSFLIQRRSFFHIIAVGNRRATNKSTATMKFSTLTVAAFCLAAHAEAFTSLSAPRFGVQVRLEIVICGLSRKIRSRVNAVAEKKTLLKTYIRMLSLPSAL